MGSPEDLSSMTVPQLKDQLREAGLTVSGNKAELIERLQANSAGQTSITHERGDQQEGELVQPAPNVQSKAKPDESKADEAGKNDGAAAGEGKGDVSERKCEGTAGQNERAEDPKASEEPVARTEQSGTGDVVLAESKPEDLLTDSGKEKVADEAENKTDQPAEDGKPKGDAVERTETAEEKGGSDDAKKVDETESAEKGNETGKGGEEEEKKDGDDNVEKIDKLSMSLDDLIQSERQNSGGGKGRYGRGGNNWNRGGGDDDWKEWKNSSGDKSWKSSWQSDSAGGDDAGWKRKDKSSWGDWKNSDDGSYAGGGGGGGGG
eukprot:CAMPEP_0171081346 /NCGR_PEP_ID=MMETSP0766_2-20121228/16438_1 /TAXON_ID=439317 /ORGANISM="Gambierdiscus australes, Strain CAWD 149" /LENGTH=319 /DNA_ID=CAMNT_0011538641 /DNA_START=52 /DNA_END=1008 /DNA_ORIENTATION=-